MNPFSKIPIYPKFAKLSLEHQTDVSNFTDNFECYSDFNFLSLWSENINDEFEVSSLNENLVVLFKNYLVKKPFLSFLGCNDVKNTISELLTISKKEGYSNFLKLIPEIDIQGFKKTEDFKICEDVDQFDYIYSIKELASLEGESFKHKRNNINKLFRIHPNCRIKITTRPTSQDIQELFELANTWMGVSKDKYKRVQSMERALLNFKLFNIEIVMIYLDDRIIAFEIHEKRGSYAMGHFKNCNPSLKVAEDYLMKEVAKHLLADGFSYINGMQDLGLPKLRYAKSLWRPSYFLKKYLVSHSRY